MKKILYAILFTFFIVTGFSQDVIVRTDKTEIKAKVTEITESVVKYKKWENPAGPVYNISNTEVFVIIYENGQREIIKKSLTTIPPNVNSVAPSTPSDKSLSSTIQENEISNIDTSIDYKNIKIKYKPTRLLYWLNNQSTVIGIQQEMRIVKNVLNIGTAVDYFFSGDYSQTLYSLYAAPYLALNRMSGNYENQDKGLFINGKIGYSSLSITIEGKTENVSGIMLGIGADYFFTKKFGISLSGFRFKDSEFNFQGGICFNIL